MNAAGKGGRKAVYPWPFLVGMVSSFLLFFSFQAIFPISPLYLVRVGGSPADNGLATWAFALASLLTRPLAGLLADRWGRKPILAIGALLFGGGPALYAFASTIPLLLVVKVFHAIGLACFSTAYLAFVADLLPPDRYGEGLGLAGIASSSAMVAAPLFGEWMVGAVDFKLSFLTFGAVGGLGLLTTLALPGGDRDAARRVSSEGGNLRDAARQPGVRAGALGMALLGLPFGAFITFLPLLADARDLGGAGLPFAVYATASTLARPVAGRGIDRWGPRGVALVGFALAGLSSAGFAAVADTWTLLGLAALFGLSFGTSSVALDTVAQSTVGHSLRGSAAAIEYTAFDTFVGFGGLGLGVLSYATNYGVMYAVAGGLVLVGVLVGGLASRARGALRM
jgi:MFS family permease